MKKEPIRLSSAKSARVIDEKFTEVLEKFVERANKEQDELTARHRAEHAGIWNNIRAASGLDENEYPDIAMAHDTVDGKLYALDANDLARIQRECPCDQCAAARAFTGTVH
ncbi:hypothetical protein [Pseudomonas phage KPP22M1]|nr:hypothetical protein [Pseudomonas phage KPP22]BAU20706.1 hypothetical protein [Pseudomonas phage KPP22M1]BAU20792.1 hypothetical protein [Pseudomonas phage KPP22M2]BAU20878.1 hypothetical protein [Pseudomonas phage KPP22M3]